MRTIFTQKHTCEAEVRGYKNFQPTEVCKQAEVDGLKSGLGLASCMMESCS